MILWNVVLPLGLPIVAPPRLVLARAFTLRRSCGSAFVSQLGACPTQNPPLREEQSEIWGCGLPRKLLLSLVIE